MTAVLDPRRALTPKWTKDQVQLMKNTVAKGTTDDEFKMFLYVCKRTGLDPFVKQIYAIKRFDSDSGAYVMGIQVGIDGFRLIAQRTGELAGIDAPVFEADPNENWHPLSATVTVYRMLNGERVAFTHTCRWSEYVQKKKDGTPTRMWSKDGMPFNQLGKCAESGAIRKAFPNDLSGLTTQDESPVIDITAADGVSAGGASEPAQADTKADTLYAGKLTAYEPKNPQKKTPHRLTLELDAGGEIRLGAYELPKPDFADPSKLIGRRCQFSYEEKPNPRGGEPFRNLKHIALEVHDMSQEDAGTAEAPAETPKESSKTADKLKAKGPIELSRDAKFAEFKALIESAPELDVLMDLYTGSIQKQWHVCAPGQRQELSRIFTEQKKALGGTD